MDTVNWWTNGKMIETATSWLWTLFVPISESLPNKPVSTQLYLSSRISRSRVTVRQWYVIKINNGLLSTYPLLNFVFMMCYSGYGLKRLYVTSY